MKLIRYNQYLQLFGKEDGILYDAFNGFSGQSVTEEMVTHFILRDEEERCNMIWNEKKPSVDSAQLKASEMANNNMYTCIDTALCKLR